VILQERPKHNVISVSLSSAGRMRISVVLLSLSYATIMYNLLREFTQQFLT